MGKLWGILGKVWGYVWSIMAMFIRGIGKMGKNRAKGLRNMLMEPVIKVSFRMGLSMALGS